jgi:hypothetical protein
MSWQHSGPAPACIAAEPFCRPGYKKKASDAADLPARWSSLGRVVPEDSVERWILVKRVGSYLIFVRPNETGGWDGGYLRLTSAPSPVTFNHGSEADAVQAVEGHLQKLPPEGPR